MTLTRQDRRGLRSTLDVGSPAYGANREASLARLAELDAELAKARAGGGPKYVDRHHGRGKLLPRERIELLLDRDAPFLELSPLAAWGSDYPVGASLVTGVGVVSGVECAISANDPTVRGGASNPWTVKKSFRADDIAEANRLPLVSLVESGGADLPSQAEIFIPGGRHLPGPDPAVRGRHPDRRAGLRQLDRRRRVRARDERPRGDGPRAGQGLPRRAAAGEDGDRRGRRRRVARRRRDARPGQRAGRPPRRGRAGRAAAGPADRVPAQLAQARARPDRAAGRAACTTRTSCSASPAPTCGCPSTRARCWPGWWTGPASTSTSRRTGPRWSPAGRRSTATRSACWPTPAASSSARSRRRPPSSSSWPTRPTPRWSSCRTPPATWSAPRTSRPASSGTGR